MRTKIIISVPLKVECVIEPDGDGYLAYIPSWLGCLSWGKTFDETKRNIIEAASLYAGCVLRETGRNVLD